MKILLDTNVLISALVFGGKTRNVLLRLMGTEHKIYVSDYVAREFAEKIHLKWPDKADALMGDKDFLDAELEKPIIFSVSMLEKFLWG